MKLLEILLEDYTLSDEKNLRSELIWSGKANRFDYFFINRPESFNYTKKINEIEVRIGLIPNISTRELTSEDLDIIYSEMKHMRNISETTLSAIVVGSSSPLWETQQTVITRYGGKTQKTNTPVRMFYDFICKIPSSGKLNDSLALALKKRNGNERTQIVSLQKALYTVDAMVDEEKYLKADETTRKMVDTWVRRMVALYGLERELGIKVSPDQSTGHPGIQTGARKLLRNKFKEELPFLIYSNIKVLVVDDNLVSGDTFNQAFNLLISKGVEKSNIRGYALTTKKVDDNVSSITSRMSP